MTLDPIQTTPLNQFAVATSRIKEVERVQAEARERQQQAEREIERLRTIAADAIIESLATLPREVLERVLNELASRLDYWPPEPR